MFRSNCAPKAEHPWRTKDEIEYIRGLGTRSYLSGVGSRELSLGERVILVRRYRNTLEKRSSWGEVDRTVVMNFIDQVLAEPKLLNGG